MAQLGLYGLGSTVALSVEAAEIAQAARTAGQPQLAQRVDAMSSAALQTSRNLQFLTMRGVVPTTNTAAADGSITMAPFITRNYSVDTVAQTLNLSTLRDADADVLERYYKSMTRTIPQAAHETFVTNALVAPWTKDHPLAAQTATSLKGAMGATMPNVEGGRKRSSSKTPTTFQSLFHVEAQAPDTPAPKALKAYEHSSPRMESAELGRSKDEAIELD